MNQISPQLVTGTVGELLLQLRLLQFGVQAAAPIKDSGNDLIAVRRHVFRAIQVKTVSGKTYGVQDLPEFYHILAVVGLVGDGASLHLDRSRIFLIPKGQVPMAPRQISRIDHFALSGQLIDALFPL